MNETVVVCNREIEHQIFFLYVVTFTNLVCGIVIGCCGWGTASRLQRIDNKIDTILLQTNNKRINPRFSTMAPAA